MTKKCGHKIKRILNVGFANGSPDSPPLLTRSFIYLKNKQIEVIHENSKNLNQTKLIFRHALGNARYRGEKQYWLFIHQSHDKNVITVRILYSKRLLEIA